MKRLFLLRHAQAANSSSGSDIDRTLTATGAAQAEALGALMAQRGYRPDRILCSGAVRTRQTLEGIKASLEGLSVAYDDTIYHASTGDLLHMIQQSDSAIENLMIIGHNPTIYQLAVMLTKDDGSQGLNTLAMGYPPASLTILGCDLSSWAEIQPGANMMLNLHRTAEYYAP